MDGRSRRRRRRKLNPNFLLVIFLAIVLVVLCIVAVSLHNTPDPTDLTDPPQTTTDPVTDPPTDPPTEPPTEPTDPTDPPTEPPTDPPTMPPTQPNLTGGSAVLAPPDVADRNSTDPSFFDDAAFIGDSVTMMLRNYNTTTKALGKATFLCAGSFGVRHAVDPNNDEVTLTYQGQKMTPQDALAACGAKKVFIMLGMNDIGLVGVDKTITNWGTFIANIREKCPDIEIYIQSGTPIYIGGEKGKLTNKNMDAYNEKLKAFAEANGCYFVDVAMYVKDANGGLAKEYCSDNYVHFTTAGAACWAKVLRAFVGD